MCNLKRLPQQQSSSTIHLSRCMSSEIGIPSSVGGPCAENSVINRVSASTAAAVASCHLANGVAEIRSPTVYSVNSAFGFDWTNYFVSQTPMSSSNYTASLNSHLTSSPTQKECNGSITNGEILSSSVPTESTLGATNGKIKRIKNCKVEIRKSFSDVEFTPRELNIQKCEATASNGSLDDSTLNDLQNDMHNFGILTKSHSESESSLSELVRRGSEVCLEDEVDTETRNYTEKKLKEAATSAAAVVITCDKNKKRVQFADDLGKTLASIKILYESSDTPPRLGSSCFKNLGCVMEADDNTSSTHGLHPKDAKFACSFVQPSSQYVVYRENLDRNNISLNSVYIDNYKVTGSITVKNLHFEKQVSVRFTTDGWINHTDIAASWSHNDSKTDTFSFTFDIPEEQTLSVELCVHVHYPLLDQDGWDNNRGQNFVIKPIKNRPQPYNRQFKPNFTNVKHFAEFSVFEHFDEEIYY